MSEKDVAARLMRLGIVGGRFSTGFLWDAHPNSTVTAVAELDEERRNTLAQRYPEAAVYTTLDEMLRDKNVDAVALFTGAPYHGPQAVQVMEAGKHVLSAVPACQSVEEAEQLIAVKERTGLTYMMAETSCFMAPTMAAREWYRQGLFGPIFMSDTEYCHLLSPHSKEGREERQKLWYRNGERTWRFCFPPVLYPTHAAAFIMHVTGEPFVAVSCFGWMDPEDADRTGPDSPHGDNRGTFVALLQGRDGHISTMKSERTGTTSNTRATLYGTKLTMYMEDETIGHPFVLHGPNADACGELPDFRDRLPEALRVDSGHGGSHPFIVNEFVSSLVEDRAPLVDLYTAINMTLPGVIAHESSKRDGERLRIPVYAPPSGV